MEVEFDPSRVTYEALLDVFWEAHDPRGMPWSRQYRSVIFFRGSEQERLARASKARIEARSGGTIHTAIEPAGPFTPAEGYHQKYRLRSEGHVMDEFRAAYPADADLVNSTAAARVNGYLAGFGNPAQLEAEADSLGLSEESLAVLRTRVGRASP